MCLFKYLPDLPSYINAADLSVSMSGYNTSVQLLYFKKRAIVIPSHEDPETAKGYCSEQVGRAKLLNDYLHTRVLTYDSFTPRMLAQAVEKKLKEKDKAFEFSPSWFSGNELTAGILSGRCDLNNSSKSLKS